MSSRTAGEGVSLGVGEDEGRRVGSAAGSTGDHGGAQRLQLCGHGPHPQGATMQGLPVRCIEGTRQVHVWHGAGGLGAAGPGRRWEQEVIEGLGLQLHAADALDGLHGGLGLRITEEGQGESLLGLGGGGFGQAPAQI